MLVLSVNFKVPVLWWSGATARLSCLHTPVETGTPPCFKVRGKSEYLLAPPKGELSPPKAVTEGAAIDSTPLAAPSEFASLTHLPQRGRQGCAYCHFYLSGSFSGEGYSTPWVSTRTETIT